MSDLVNSMNDDEFVEEFINSVREIYDDTGTVTPDFEAAIDRAEAMLREGNKCCPNCGEYRK